MDKIRITAPNDRGAYGKSQKVSLAELAEMIRTDNSTKEICQIIRTDNSLSKNEIKNIKQELRGVELHSVCNGSRTSANVVALTGYCVFDYDEENVPYDVFKRNIINDTTINPCLVFFSPQGKLKVVVKIRELEGLTGTPEELKAKFEFYYKQMMTYLAKRYAAIADTACCDAVRLTYLSHDSDVYVNDGAYTNMMFKDYGDTVVEDEYDDFFFNRKSNTNMSVAFTDANKVGLQSVLLEFAQFCLKNKITILDEYNSWLGFGANCKMIFDNADDAIAVWDACSCFSENYEDDCCKRKYHQLPSATYVGVMGQIYNLFKYDYPHLAYTYNIKDWLFRVQKKYGLM